MKKNLAINKNVSAVKTRKNHLLYAFFLILLIFLGLLSLKTITLDKLTLTAIGIIAIGVIFFLTFINLRNLLLIFILYLPFSRLLPGDFGTGIWAFNLTNVFLIAIIISIGINNLRNNTRLTIKSSISFPILFFCFLVIISFAKTALDYGQVYFNEFFSGMKEWLTPMLLFFIFLAAIRDEADIKEVAYLIIIITVAISFLVVFNYLLEGRGAESIEKMRIGAIFGQPNSAGAFFVYYSFLLPGFLLVNVRKLSYWLFTVPILVSMRALMYTYSRGAIVAFVLAGLFITFLKNKLIFVLLCMLLMFLYLNPTVMPSSLYERFSSTFAKDTQMYTVGIEERLEPSSQKRVIIWRGALQMIKDYPLFGVGYGLFPKNISFYVPVGERDAHNTYLTIAAELGLIGLLVFLLILLLIFKNTWFVYRRTSDKFIKALSLGFLAGIFGLLVCNFSGSRLDSQEVTGFFWILTALIFKSKQLIKEGQL